MDIEVRYALDRGDSGILHLRRFSPTRPPIRAAGEGESRYITKLNTTFDWISVDADRNMLECTTAGLGHGRRRPRQGAAHPEHRHLQKFRRAQIQLQRRAIQDPRLRLVEHQGPHRHLVHQPHHRIPQRRRGQAGTGLPLRRNDNPTRSSRLLARRPLRRRRELQHPRRRRLEQSHRPDFRLLQLAGRSQRPHRRPTSTRSTATAGNPTVPPAWHDNAHRPVAGRARTSQNGKSRSGPTTGSTAWITRTKTSAATSPANSCSTTRRPPRPNCRT